MSDYPSGRPTRAEIDLSALRRNFEIARGLSSPAKVLAVVKAEAYGHGLIRISKELEALGAEYLGVSFLEEGVALREAGIRSPILVMGGLVDEQISRYFDNDLTMTVSSVWKAKQVESAAEIAGVRARVHLKFDTGMGRVGQNWETAGLLLEAASALPRLDLEGVYTHFASSESEDGDFTRLQCDRFDAILDQAASMGLQFRYIHSANSGAILRKRSPDRCNLVRPGLLLYGYAPLERLSENVGLQPVMTLKSHVVFIKKPISGTPIGYGSTWKSPGGRWIATLPIGYGDGFPRRAGNRASVRLRGRNRRIVGNVSMDQITIDAGEEAYLGDGAILFGGDNGESLWELSKAIEAIPYEILCGLNARVPRIFIGDR